MILNSQLFVIAVAVKPADGNPDAAHSAWALLRFWVLSHSGDEALVHARRLIASGDFESRWQLATRTCAFNLAAHWRGPVPNAARNLTDVGTFVIEEETASASTQMPDFDRLFGDDALTTRIL